MRAHLKNRREYAPHEQRPYYQGRLTRRRRERLCRPDEDSWSSAQPLAMLMDQGGAAAKEKRGDDFAAAKLNEPRPGGARRRPAAGDDDRSLYV